MRLKDSGTVRSKWTVGLIKDSKTEGQWVCGTVGLIEDRKTEGQWDREVKIKDSVTEGQWTGRSRLRTAVRAR